MTAVFTAEPDLSAIDAGVDELLHATGADAHYLWVDPRNLRRTGNSRDVGDIRESRPDLVASMAAHGFDTKISVIPVVRDPDGVLRVVTGFSRTAAAISVIENENPDLRVAVLVQESSSRRDELIAQGIENIQRKDFTTAEKAGLYLQLSLEGLDDDAIARELGQPANHIRAGRVVADSGVTSTAAQQRPQIDLLTWEKLAPFADDPETHDYLVNRLDVRPDLIDHEIETVRNNRERNAILAQERTLYAEAGYTLIEDDDDLPDGTARLEDLVTSPDTDPIESGQHIDCPGRAVHIFVDSDLSVDVTHFCTSFAEHGHQELVAVKVAAAEQQLREQGVRVVDADTDGTTELFRLFVSADDHRVLEPDLHAGCLGHAAYVAPHMYRPEAVIKYVCTDYSEHEHALRFTAPTSRAEPNAAYVSGEKKRARVNNAAWKLAKTRRREWLSTYFTDWATRKPTSLPKRVQHLLAMSQISGGDYLTEAAPHYRYACALLGIDFPRTHVGLHPIVARLKKPKTTEVQAIMIRLALAVGAGEEHWDKAYTDGANASWRQPTDATRFHFTLLKAMGYKLTPVEDLVLNPSADEANWPHLRTSDTEAA